ncbi:type IV secretory system conjugative DNA transfer family protein [Quadrisphaera oryzae]|nr:type IV secretory system conjugative DNA transfer family protein [Quadrisphaera sp. RL12-1S]
MMAPRAGKTTTLTAPIVRNAPGPVLATSIKSDLWEAT